MAKKKLGYRLPDELWARLEPLLPARVNPHPLGGGRPRRADRDCADAIFFVLRTGCQWEALDATGICPHSTAHDRFQEWVTAGVWEKLWAVLLQEYDELHGLDWSYLSVEGSMTKAPLATVGEKKRAESDGPWQARRETQRGDRGGGRAGRSRRGGSQSQ
jgi:transposase